ncbi:MAG: cytochrome c oxidase subunit 3 [Alphaproteobacteria bacterium]|nr:cytochrome c oxidase subunit 3 [Alphaproteobacteria bacterium]MCB9975273.1 cytochrome c oxidase subunit 3 [Rhodospirillales bacterium]
MADHIEYTTTGKPHPYHLVRPSIWPLMGALAGGLLAVGAVMYMHEVRLFEQPGIEGSGVPVGLKGVFLGLAAVLLVMVFWWRDVIHEAVGEKAHSPIAKVGFRYGMSLFIASEVMFFVAFFWAFFSSAFYPSEFIGSMWPPEGMHVVDPFDLPLLMTMILLLSGGCVTWAHHALLEDDKKATALCILLASLLGFFFMGFQVYEYAHAHFAFTDTVYASTFFMATGFHGFHVVIGAIFLFVCWIRALKGHFTAKSHFGFEAAAWYWHFVDVVWLFLFIAVYIWGNEIGMNHAGH